MAKQVMIILGSPRKSGNCAALAEQAFNKRRYFKAPLTLDKSLEADIVPPIPFDRNSPADPSILGKYSFDGR
jgi:hypothetical protein